MLWKAVLLKVSTKSALKSGSWYAVVKISPTFCVSSILAAFRFYINSHHRNGFDHGLSHDKKYSHNFDYIRF